MTLLFNKILALGAIFLQIFFVAILLAYLFRRQSKFLSFVKNKFGLIVLLISGASIFFSLIYSELIGFPPCKLCWFQRIFIYPQFIIAIFAIARKKIDEYVDIILTLSFIGTIISVFHIFVEKTGSDLLECGASGVPCDAIFVEEFGYITIPVMALSSFLTILISAFIYKKIKR